VTPHDDRLRPYTFLSSCRSGVEARQEIRDARKALQDRKNLVEDFIFRWDNERDAPHRDDQDDDDDEDMREDYNQDEECQQNDGRGEMIE
jgi:hypothetical protein